ncbi:DUF3987 domain-containing protein [Bacteroides sp.]|uniref:DUF3987 domain-containing protein n=1 Tax=Bacteroides sp. TaxID=29523 RepID=UPI0025B87FA1|nr:DUF3987 domain-containing protein [Bacteroides sp.]
MKDTDQKKNANSESPGSVSEFPGVRSKTSRTITIREFVDTVRSDRYRRQVLEYRRLKALPGHEAEAQAIKENMPCIVPAGVCLNGHAVKDLSVHSRLLCVDLDHTDRRTQEVFGLACSLPFTYASIISISGEGIKMLVRVRMEDVRQDYARLYAAVGNAVSAHVGHPYDEKCKILTQPCFYSYHPEAYYNAEAVAFEMPEVVPASAIHESASSASASSASAASATATSATEKRKMLLSAAEAIPGDVRGSVPTSACGFIPRLLDDFERNNPFRRGNRNDLALKLGRVAGSKGFSPDEMEKLISLFSDRYASGDFTAEDIRQRVVAGYQFVECLPKEQKEPARGQKGVRVTYTPVCGSNEEDAPEVVLEKNDELRADAPYIPDTVFASLPDFLIRCCRYTSDKRERDMALLGCLNSCSAIFPYVSFLYKRSLYSPHFYLASVAAAGAGKGIMAFTAILLDPTQEYYDQIRRANKKAYEQALLGWDSEQQQARREKRLPDINLKPEEPKAQYLKISATTSKSRLIEHLATAGEVGCCMATTEINTMVSSLGQDCGKYEDILCKAAHHEEVSSSYKVDGEPIVVKHPHLALNIAGTQEQFYIFFRSLEVGLFSRFAFYTRQQSQKWESCAPGDEQVDLRGYFQSLGKELLEMHKVLLESPTLVTFSPAQWQLHTTLFSELLRRVLLEGRDSSGSLIRRAGLLGMRLAAILTIFRKWEDYRYAKEYCCTDADFRMAMDIVRTLVEHSLLLSTSLPDTNQPPVSMHRFHRLDEILSSLSKEFTYTDFVRSVQNTGMSESTGKRFLQKALKLQYIVKEENSYRKRRKPSSGQGYK